MTLKMLGWFALAAVATFGAGWFVGASGRSDVEQARRHLEERADLAAARAAALDGRVNLFLSNFGDASRRFEEARGVIEGAQTRLRQIGDAARAGQLEMAVAQLREAQRLALALDASAQKAAAEAVGVIDAVSSANR